jgi:site-specific DNA recombinase
LDDLVWRDLCELITDPRSLSQALERARGGHWAPQAAQARREQLRQGRLRVQRQVERLTEAYLQSVLPLAEYQRRRTDLERQDDSLRQQAHDLEAQSRSQHDVAVLVTSLEELCQRIQTGLCNATFEQKRQLVELLIDRVVVTNGDVEIRYVFPLTPASEHVRFCHLRTDYFDERPLAEQEPVGEREELVAHVPGATW